jgi:hypothetical protein
MSSLLEGADQLLRDPSFAIKRGHDRVVGELVVGEHGRTNFAVARDRGGRSQNHRGGKHQPKGGDCRGVESLEARNAQRRGRGDDDAYGRNLRPSHSAPGAEARGQTAKGDIEQLLAAARAHEAGEALRRGERERP